MRNGNGTLDTSAGVGTLAYNAELYLIAAGYRYRETSLRQIRSCLGLFCRYAGPHARADTTRLDQLLLFLDHCRKVRRNRGSALRAKARILKGFFTWLEATGKIPLSPALPLKLPRREQPRVEPLPREAIVQVIQHLNQIVEAEGNWLAFRDLIVIVLLYGLGLRLSEACRLETPDLRYSTALGDHLVIRPEISKGGYSGGIAPLTPETARLLRQWFAMRRQVLPVEVNPYIIISDPLKSSRAKEGRPVDASTIQRRLKVLFTRYSPSGLITGSVHPHRLRHSFAVEHLMHDNDLKTVSRLLRHRNPQTTLITYSTFTEPQVAIKARRHSPLNGLL